MKQNHFDVIILGAGAAGLMCAAWLRQYGKLNVAVIEGNAKAAAKLKISGGGKCNITNTDVQAKHFLGEKRVIEEVLACFSKEDLLSFLHDSGLVPVVRKGRYYFCPKSSDDIIGILLRLAKGTTLLYERKIKSVEKKGAFFVETEKGCLKAKNVIVATGGISFASLGSTGIGLEIARHFGHEVTPFSPALVGLTLQKEQFWMKELSGVSLPVRISVAGRSVEEDMLFAHRGISGPAVLSASLYWHKGTVTVDFLPSKNIAALCKNRKKQISTVMNLPKRFSKAFLEHIGVVDKACGKLSPDEIVRLGRLHAYSFAPAGTFGFTKAEVSRGGVKTDGIDPATMQSEKTEGLYFIGEVVDVTGELGGYNFQWAFSSAVSAARALIKKV